MKSAFAAEVMMDNTRTQALQLKPHSTSIDVTNLSSMAAFIPQPSVSVLGCLVNELAPRGVRFGWNSIPASRYVNETNEWRSSKKKAVRRPRWSTVWSQEAGLP